MLGPVATRWTGWHTFELSWRSGSRVSIDVNVRRDGVSVWMNNFTLAVIDRDLLRDWFIHPREPLIRDDLEWSSQDGVTCLAIGASAGLPVPADTVGFLMAVI